MSPQPQDQVMVKLATLSTKVGNLTNKIDSLSAQVAAQEKRLHLVYTAVVLAVGIVGGPNAFQAITGQ